MVSESEQSLRCGESPGLVVAIGSSAGGLVEVIRIAESLGEWFRGTIIFANHRPPESGNRLHSILAGRARIEVEEPEDEDCLEKSTIYVGHASDTVEVDGAEFDVDENTSMKSRLRRIDDLFASVAESSGVDAVGVVLSGALSDGALGLKAIYNAGGYCMVQDPEHAEHDSMPACALSMVPDAFVGTTDDIISKLMEISMRRNQI
ncbi:chemotaxis protein CheB [Rhodopirellula europaea]|uniref:chemotaxis protein CheB n=1 Tax=Rhodopirellula europaea TaxID=1263866 RepID=UPI001F3E3A7B|nr:chemotaxis protein CheB [Rhodopirellula europaea]